MRFKMLPGPESGPFGTRRQERVMVTGLAGAVLGGAVALLSFAQSTTQLPERPPHPILLPEANRPPDANQQMEMREQKQKKHTFDAANAERLRQMTEASHMLETLAIALKAELDNAGSSQLSENEIHKAEAIEKLARLVREQMQLTVAPN